MVGLSFKLKVKTNYKLTTHNNSDLVLLFDYVPSFKKDPNYDLHNLLAFLLNRFKSDNRFLKSK